MDFISFFERYPFLIYGAIFVFAVVVVEHMSDPGKWGAPKPLQTAFVINFIFSAIAFPFPFVIMGESLMIGDILSVLFVVVWIANNLFLIRGRRWARNIAVFYSAMIMIVPFPIIGIPFSLYALRGLLFAKETKAFYRTKCSEHPEAA